MNTSRTKNNRFKGKPSNAAPNGNSRNRGGQRPSGKGRPPSKINVSLLSQKAKPLHEEVFTPKTTFADWNLEKSLLKAIENKNFLQPTEVQEKTLEPLLAGKNLIGVARTGTGKTGAFLIPIIHRLLKANKNFNTLVLAPTRELAVQIEEEFKSLTKGMGLHSACFIGGTNLNRDLNTLAKRKHLVVGTPGRLLDLAQRKALYFKDFEVLVLDEFDRMLDMGFAADVERITRAMTKRQQTLLFSATLNQAQMPLIKKMVGANAEQVKVSNGEVTAEHIDQETIRLNEGEDKFKHLLNMLQSDDFDKVLVFAETKRWVSRVYKKLHQSGITTDEIHGNKSQNYRQKALDKFKKGSIQVLVATDVAARGLDVSDVSHVINYQLPASMDSYIHRIGRTGRAGKTGKAYTFVN
jgi:ATP-dependent RNA helicase RhlE